MESYNPLAARALGLQDLIIRAAGASLEDVSPELAPSLEVGELPPELRILAGHRILSLSMLVAAVAAENSYVGLRNPANSGVIARVQVFVTEPTGGGIYSVQLNNADATRTLDAAIVSSDTRWAATASACHAISGTEPAGGSGINVGRFAQAVNNITVYPQVFVLGPGTNIIVMHLTVNTAFNGGFLGYERSARPEELAFG